MIGVAGNHQQVYSPMALVYSLHNTSTVENGFLFHIICHRIFKYKKISHTLDGMCSFDEQCLRLSFAHFIAVTVYTCIS